MNILFVVRKPCQRPALPYSSEYKNLKFYSIVLSTSTHFVAVMCSISKYLILRTYFISENYGLIFIPALYGEKRGYCDTPVHPFVMSHHYS